MAIDLIRFSMVYSMSLTINLVGLPMMVELVGMGGAARPGPFIHRCCGRQLPGPQALLLPATPGCVNRHAHARDAEALTEQSQRGSFAGCAAGSDSGRGERVGK